MGNPKFLKLSHLKHQRYNLELIWEKLQKPNGQSNTLNKALIKVMTRRSYHTEDEGDLFVLRTLTLCEKSRNSEGVFCPYFPHCVNLPIQAECEKIWTRM